MPLIRARPGVPPQRTLPVLIAVWTATVWLLVLTALNLATHGSFRTTLLFAIPVCIVAWDDWQTGFVFAAVAIVCAWIGGAMPEPDSTEPLWVDALLAFAKLSFDALVAFTWGLRIRTKARSKPEKPSSDPVD